METVELACEPRETHPASRLTALRAAGGVPAVLYGPRRPTLAVALESKQLAANLRSAARQRLMRLRSSAAELDGRHVIIKEVQRRAVSGAIIHADLFEVDLSRPLRVSVPLKFAGRPAGVAAGGILQPLMRELEIECPPLEIPDAIEVDVSALGVHDAIHVSALKLAAGIKAVAGADPALVTVLPPTVAEAPAKPAEAAGAPAGA